MSKINKQEFWESIAVLAIAAIFIAGGSFGVYKFTSSTIVGWIGGNKIKAELKTAIKTEKENDSKLEKRKAELLKAPIYSAPFLGSEEAKVTLEAFFDFNCPYARIFFTDDIMKKVRYKIAKGGDFKMEFRNYPSLSEKSAEMALAAACAGEQGRFWQMSEQLLKNQSEIQKNKDLGLEGYANEIGLNMNLFEYCVSEKKYSDSILQDIARAEKMGIKKVPMFAINGKIVKEGLPSENELENWLNQ